MSKAQIDLFGDEDCEYNMDFIVNNPIPAKCTRQNHWGCRNRVANIHAPQLDNVRCFWCGSELEPMDKKVYQERIANLWQHVSQ